MACPTTLHPPCSSRLGVDEAMAGVVSQGEGGGQAEGPLHCVWEPEDKVKPEKPARDCHHLCPPFTREPPEGWINEWLDDCWEPTIFYLMAVEKSRLERWEKLRGDPIIGCDNLLALIETLNFPHHGPSKSPEMLRQEAHDAAQREIEGYMWDFYWAVHEEQDENITRGG